MERIKNLVMNDSWLYKSTLNNNNNNNNKYRKNDALTLLKCIQRYECTST